MSPESSRGPQVLGGVDRSGSFDSLRGVIMIGVVLSHVLVGVNDAGLMDARFGWINPGLYLVHLPLFAFLAGLTLGAAAEKRHPGRYFLDRLGLFAYLYVVWTLIQGGVELLTNAVRNNQTSLEDVLSLWTPIAHLWFLTWLAVATAAALVIRPWRNQAEGRQAWRWQLAAVLGIASLWAWGIEGATVPERGMALTAFFLAGSIVTRERWERWISAQSTAGLAGTFAVSVGLFVTVLLQDHFSTPTTQDAARDVSSVMWGVLGTVSGSSALVILVTLASRSGLTMRLLQRVGRESLPIFLMHLVFTAGTRVLLAKAGIDEAWAQVILGTVAGVLLPLLLLRWIRATPFLAWVISPPWPSAPTRRPHSTPLNRGLQE